MKNIFYRNDEGKSLSNDELNRIVEENIQISGALINVKKYFKKHRDIRGFRYTYHRDGWWCFDSNGLCFAECATHPSQFSFKGVYHKKDMYKLINARVELSNKLVEETRILLEQKLIPDLHKDSTLSLNLTYNKTFSKEEAKGLFSHNLTKRNFSLLAKLISHPPYAKHISGFYQYNGNLYVGYRNFAYLKCEEKYFDL